MNGASSVPSPRPPLILPVFMAIGLAIGLGTDFGLALSPASADTLLPASPAASPTSTLTARSDSLSNRAAHPISKMVGSFYVARDRVSVRLRLFVEDLYLFHESVEPDEQDRVYADTLLPAAEAHRQFLLDRVRILDVNGQPLPSRVIDVTPLEVPEEGWAVDQLMEHTLDYELEFTLASPPEFLTFVQEVVDANFVFPSELEIVVRQEGTELIEGKILRPSDPWTLRFAWDRPALDPQANREAFERMMEEDREQVLGITSYDAVYSFLYITRLEVRHEILIPLATLATVIELPHANPNFLTVAEQETAREIIRQYQLGGNPVSIDGVQVTPIVDRIDFYGLDLKDFAQRAEPRDVSMASGRVGVILRYPTVQEASEVKLTWTQFSSVVRKVSTVVFAKDQTLKAEFSRFKDDNTFSWTNPAPNLEPRGVTPVPADLPPPILWPPLAVVALAMGSVTILIAAIRRAPRAAAALTVITLGVAASLYTRSTAWTIAPWSPVPKIETAERERILRGLIANTYRAFDYTDEESIYDSLDRTATGDLLSDLYLEVRGGLVLQEQGGAVATVEGVEFVELETDISPSGASAKAQLPAVPAPGFRARCRWNVAGSVEHWGHVHRRVNQYAADFDVAPIAGQWKLTRMALTDEQRLENRRTLRRF